MIQQLHKDCQYRVEKVGGIEMFSYNSSECDEMFLNNDKRDAILRNIKVQIFVGAKGV